MANKPTNTQVHESSVTTASPELLIKEVLCRLGVDADEEHFARTPARVVKSWNELFGGYGKTAEEALGTTFKSKSYDQMVICKDIELYSTCAHHMIPFFGKAHIGYIPGKKVVGLSKLARLVEVYSRRLQVQEELTQQIAESLWRILKPKGVMVVLEAKHLCMCARGVQKQHSSMVTSSVYGVFKTISKARSEFLCLIK